MTHDDIKSRITPHLSAFKAVRDAVDLAEKTVNTNDRERIAELERDLAHARASQSETTARTIIAFCNESVGFAALGNSHVETAIKALYHRLTEARANLAQNAAITETLRAELALLKDGIEMNNGWPAHSPGATATPVVEEEQGPWVVLTMGRGYGLPMARCLAEGMLGTVRSSELDKAMVFRKKADAERQCAASDERVVTLAEAHRIAGAK